MTPFSPNALDVMTAALRLEGHIHRTPLLRSRSFDERAGVQAFLKAENLQRGGSFKIRGAGNFLLRLREEGSAATGVVAYSSGNHAQAVAMAAQWVGLPATIVMPDDAPRSKREATAARGATIVTYDRMREDREAIGRRIAEESGATLVPPFDHPWIVAGQGTTAKEMLDEVPDLDTLAVCLGGGGLLAGCALLAKERKPSIRLYGVEPEDGNDYWLSLRAGERVGIPPPATIADGLRTTRPGEVPFPIIQRDVDGVVLVSDAEIRETVRFLAMRLKIVVEPSGAAAAAAVLFGKLPPGGRKVGVTLSGGNVDWEALAEM